MKLKMLVSALLGQMKLSVEKKLTRILLLL